MKTVDSSDFGYIVSDVTRLLRRVFDRRAARLDLTRAQWLALSRIARSQGLTQAELAQELDLEPIAVGRVIDRLEASGFIERRADPDDRRCWRLHLASKSADVMATMKKIAAALRSEVLAGVAPEDLATTMRVLAQVKDTLNRLDRDDRQAAARGRSLA